MSDLWVVLLLSHGIVYGPMSEAEAKEFARWMTVTVDPAEPRKLHSPAAEILGWWRSESNRNDCTHGSGCEVHPDVRGLHDFDDDAYFAKWR
jgi:hypothetical protein